MSHIYEAHQSQEEQQAVGDWDGGNKVVQINLKEEDKDKIVHSTLDVVRFADSTQINFSTDSM